LLTVLMDELDANPADPFTLAPSYELVVRGPVMHLEYEVGYAAHVRAGQVVNRPRLGRPVLRYVRMERPSSHALERELRAAGTGPDQHLVPQAVVLQRDERVRERPAIERDIGGCIADRRRSLDRDHVGRGTVAVLDRELVPCRRHARVDAQRVALADEAENRLQPHSI